MPGRPMSTHSARLVEVTTLYWTRHFVMSFSMIRLDTLQLSCDIVDLPDSHVGRHSRRVHACSLHGAWQPVASRQHPVQTVSLRWRHLFEVVVITTIDVPSGKLLPMRQYLWYFQMNFSDGRCIDAASTSRRKRPGRHIYSCLPSWRWSEIPGFFCAKIRDRVLAIFNWICESWSWHLICHFL